MKALKYFFTLVAVVLVITACKNETSPETKTVDFDNQTEEKSLNPDANYIAAKFEIDGMMCAMGCAKVIEKNLAQMNGVKKAEVHFESKIARIEYDEAVVNPDLVMAKVKQTGDAYAVTSWNGEAVSQSEEKMVE